MPSQEVLPYTGSGMMSDRRESEGQEPLLGISWSGEEDMEEEEGSVTPPVTSPLNHSGELRTSLSSDGLPGPAVSGECTKTYKRRWYVLIIYSLFTCTYSCVWNCWGPISSASEAAFGWGDSTIALLTNLGPIAYMAAGFLFPWFLQVRGLRWAMLISVLVLGVATTLRCISSHPTTATILIYAGQGLNGLVGPMAMAAIPQVSSVWFPPNERVTATSISNSFCIFGYATSFLLGPAFVSDVPSNSTHANHTDSNFDVLIGFDDQEVGQGMSGMSGPHNVSDWKQDATSSGNSSVAESLINKARREIMRYMYIECGWSWLLFLAVLVYFPAKPPLPPGRSAVAGREDYWGGLWSLRSKLGFLLVAFCYGISTGVTAGWAAMLNVTLKPYGVHQAEAGWIGFYAIAGSCVIALLLCRFADHFIRHIKVFIVLLYSLGTAAFLVFALITIDVVSFSIGLVYVVVIAGFTLTNGAIPLLFELACELAYPTSESAASGFLVFLNNLFCLLFLLVLSFPHVGVEWEHWMVVASCFLCIPLIALLKSRFNRLNLDELEQSLLVEEPDDNHHEDYNDVDNNDGNDNDDDDDNNNDENDDLDIDYYPPPSPPRSYNYNVAMDPGLFQNRRMARRFVK